MRKAKFKFSEVNEETPEEKKEKKWEIIGVTVTLVVLVIAILYVWVIKPKKDLQAKDQQALLTPSIFEIIKKKEIKARIDVLIIFFVLSFFISDNTKSKIISAITAIPKVQKYKFLTAINFVSKTINGRNGITIHIIAKIIFLVVLLFSPRFAFFL